MSSLNLNSVIKQEFQDYLINCTIDDFTVLNMMGRGAYGSVLIVKKNDTSKVYTMRIISKNDLSILNDKLVIKNDRFILEKFDFPFISKLDIVFYNKHRLYLLGEHISNLSIEDSNGQRKFDSSSIKLIGAQLVLTLDFLHKQGIVYKQ